MEWAFIIHQRFYLKLFIYTASRRRRSPSILHRGECGAASLYLFKQDLSAWTVTACTSFTNFYTGDMNAPNSATNQTNYNALLLSWSTQALQAGLTFTMGSTKYSSSAAAARLTLTDTYVWSVSDGGVAP